MKTKRNIVNLLYENKQHLNEDGYLHFENSIEKPVYGVSEDNRCLKFHWIDGVQLLFNDEMRIWEIVVWLSTEQSEVLGKANLIFVPETFYDAIYEEANHTLMVLKSYKQKQSTKTTKPMKTNYEETQETILAVQAELMSKAETTEEQEAIREAADIVSKCNRECEVERLIDKFGGSKFLPVKIVVFDDYHDNKVHMFNAGGLVWVTKGELVPENEPIPYHRFDAESQMTLLKLLREDIKSKLIKGRDAARVSYNKPALDCYTRLLKEEFGIE